MEQSEFLKGNNSSDWSANFDWVMKDRNLAKVLDGNYKNREEKADERNEAFLREILEE